jgi:hypothetical protein
VHLEHPKDCVDVQFVVQQNDRQQRIGPVLYGPELLERGWLQHIGCNHTALTVGSPGTFVVSTEQQGFVRLHNDNQEDADISLWFLAIVIPVFALACAACFIFLVDDESKPVRCSYTRVSSTA